MPNAAETLRLLKEAAELIPSALLWVAPVCGLKTRGWAVTEAALAGMAAAARELRREEARVG